MPEFTRDQILQMLDQFERQIQALRKIVKQELPERKWISTTEYAQHRNTTITAKTAANYCRMGRLKCKKSPTGQWLIHRSELFN
jgi:hypothetical protein